jgi:hypothetical protein
VRDAEKASLVPSPDHAGDRFVPPMCGKFTVRFRSSEYIMISHPLLVIELNAMREPSGEMRGDNEIEFKRVIWCWLEPS